MCNYFKKLKLYSLLTSLTDKTLLPMKYATYKFHRGAEWLTCPAVGDLQYKIYHNGAFLSVDACVFNNITIAWETIDRKTYRIYGMNVEQVYHRGRV